MSIDANANALVSTLRRIATGLELLAKAPMGRSVPLGTHYCDDDCSGYDRDPKPPHLWSEHDSTRAYSDPDGWAAHVAQCEMCRA